MVEPSGQGEATAVPARPIAQVPCSYTPYPWASAGRAPARSAAVTTKVSQTQFRGISGYLVASVRRSAEDLTLVHLGGCQGNSRPRCAIETDLKSILSWARQGNVEHQHGACLQFGN